MLQRLGKTLGRAARDAIDACMGAIWPRPACRDASSIAHVRKILLVRSNFRMGNTILATALLPVLRQRFPDARVDYLVGEGSAVLLRGLPIAYVHTISQRFILAPWRFAGLILRLRRRRFDLAVCPQSSFSAALFAYLSGARQRLGITGHGDRFLTICVDPPLSKRPYDRAKHYARVLGVGCSPRTQYRVSGAEDEVAVAILSRLGLRRDRAVAPFLAAFVGGHLSKRVPRQDWLDLFGELRRIGLTVVVFVGLEETAFADLLRSNTAAPVYVVPPQPLRVFGALLARATLLLTPDSGPMHLAAALDVPIIALLRRERSRRWLPGRPEDRELLRPDAATVLATLRQHPRWELIAPDPSRCPPPVVLGGPQVDEQSESSASYSRRLPH